VAKLASDELNKRLTKALKLAGNTHTIEDIQHAVARGEMQCFANKDSFVITEISQAPRARYLNIFLAVGNLSVVTFLPDIEKFAEENGCLWVQAIGRPGWKTILPDNGYEETQVVFVKKLGIKNG
jgi:hypothetical protein